MIAFTKLLRRTAVALSAIAALTVTGLATAQTVTLSGTSSNSCTYSQMTATAGTANLTFTCGSSTVANFAITAPTQLPQSVTSATDVKVTRTGGLTGAIDVGLSVGGNCTSTLPTTITFASNGSQNIPLVTGLATAGACTVQISPVSGSVTSTNPVSINIVDPDSDVTFAFAATDTLASVGGPQVSITLNRSGGTNGSFTIPVTVPASPALVGSILPTSYTFAANQLTASVVYTPPTTNVSGLPNTWVLGLGTIAKGATNAATQNATVSAAANTNNLTVGPKSTTCNAVVNSINMTDVPTVQLPSGVMYTYELPRTYARKVSGTFKMSSTSISNPVAPWNYEFQISKCAGQIDSAVGGTCYISSSNSAQLSLTWFESVPLTGSVGATAGYGSIAGIQAKGACYAPATEGPWYVNIRYNYPDCNAAISGHPLCGWKATAALWSY